MPVITSSRLIIYTVPLLGQTKFIVRLDFQKIFHITVNTHNLLEPVKVKLVGFPHLYKIHGPRYSCLEIPLSIPNVHT